MKNESMEQLNALKSCPFSPGAIWSAQQVMLMVKIHVPVFIIIMIKNSDEFGRHKIKTRIHLSAILTDLKNLTLKKIKMGSGPFSRVGRGRSPYLFSYEA